MRSIQVNFAEHSSSLCVTPWEWCGRPLLVAPCWSPNQTQSRPLIVINQDYYYYWSLFMCENQQNVYIWDAAHVYFFAFWCYLSTEQLGEHVINHNWIIMYYIALLFCLFRIFSFITIILTSCDWTGLSPLETLCVAR